MNKSFFFRAGVAILSTLAAFSASAWQSVSPTQAYNLVANNSNYYILDVRTAEEWRWVGHPGKNALGEGAALDGKVANIAYMMDYQKSYIVNPSFVSDVEGMFGAQKQNVVLILLCRSGVRSVAAANLLEPLGFTVLNVYHGFEGDGDARGYRTTGGWKVEGMPYNQKAPGAYAD